MKPQTFFRLSLFIPFILWILCAFVTVPLTMSSIDIPETWNTILMPAMFYLIGILLWFIPYTTLAIILWIWSKNRSASALRNAALTSPFFLSFLMVLEAGLIYQSTNDLAEFVQSAFNFFALFGGLSMLFGYLCVGIAFGTLKLLQTRNLILVQESPTTGS